MKTLFKVQVHYPAAEEPFRDDFPASATVGDVRKAAMTAFGLVEGQLPDGSTVSYPMYFEKQRLDNPSVTLGELAGERSNLEFRLAQQVTQGR
jgi:hypothetical protein